MTSAQDIIVGGRYAIAQPPGWRTAPVVTVLEVAEHQDEAMARVAFDQFEDWVTLDRVVCTEDELRTIKTRLGDDVVYRPGGTGGWERVDQH
jgi:hypothetical protein